MVIGPITGASLNPARAFGPEFVSMLGDGLTNWNQLIPVYVLPGLVGAGAAAFLYDYLAEPRQRGQPIRRAVSTDIPPSNGVESTDGPRPRPREVRRLPKWQLSQPR